MAEEIKRKGNDRRLVANILSGALILMTFIFFIKLGFFLFYKPKNASVLPVNSIPQTIQPMRGTIYDANGNPLAIATPSYDIILECKIHREEWVGDKTVAKIKNDPNIANKEREIAVRKAREDYWLKNIPYVAAKIDSILRTDSDCKILYKGGAQGLQDSILAHRTTIRRNLTVAKNVDHKHYLEISSLPLVSYTTFENPQTEKKESFSGAMLPPTEKNENYRVVRNYPYGQLARKVIGESNNITRTYNRTGIEGRYDAALRGIEGRIFVTKVDGRKEMVDVDSTNVEVQNGYDIHTTLDVRIQEIAHRALIKNLELVSNHPTYSRPCFAGTAIVMDSKTGAIKAMVNVGLDEKDGKWKENQMNMAVNFATSPGSVFKTVLLMQLLEDGKVTLDTKIPTFKGHYDAGIFSQKKGSTYDDEDLYPGFTKKNKHIGEVYANNYDYIKLRDGLAISSNNVFRYLVVNHYGQDPTPYVNRIYDLHFREALEFDIENPATPKFPSDPLTKGPTLPTLAIGTNIDVTPLHVLTYYNALALDGKMIQPYLIDHFSKDGEVIMNTDFGNTGARVLKSSICSKETVQTIKTGLREVVLYGTATDLKNLPEEVAGKTGTARYFSEFTRADGTKYMAYEEEGTGRMRYQATFVGFWPYQDPKYTVIVVMYSKPLKGKTLFGSASVPAFKEIYNEIYGMGL